MKNIHFLTVVFLLISNALLSQTKNTNYSIGAPPDWTVEQFTLPPEFAPDLSLRGDEYLRLHPQWMNPNSQGNWTYVFLWAIHKKQQVNEQWLKRNLEVYYDGLLRRFIESNKIPSSKVFAAKANVTEEHPQTDDEKTFKAVVHMLSFMSQQPVNLHAIIHVKKNKDQNKLIWFELSLQKFESPIWEELHKIQFELK